MAPWYCLFALTLLPLAISLLAADDDVGDRLVKTLDDKPEIAVKLDADQNMTKEKFLSLLPDGRIDGAHLPYDTWMHWLYALLAAGGFFAALLLLFPRGNALPKHLLLLGLCTGTFGIVFLLGVQWISQITYGRIFVGRSIIVLLFNVLKLIGFSYRAATDPSVGFWLSFLGYTFGIGLCEELTKALPVLFSFRGGAKLDWRGACMWGLASGVGFGVAEGIMYSSEYYNGLSSGLIYVVRFVSCTGLHAIWGGAVGIMVWRRRDWMRAQWDWGEMAVSMLYVLAVPMVLHGLYDTLLKKEMNGWAVVAAVASFAWLFVLTEWTRRE